MANFFTDEIFTCSCGSMLFQEREIKSYKIANEQLFYNTSTKVIKCETCGREYSVDSDDKVLEQA